MVNFENRFFRRPEIQTLVFLSGFLIESIISGLTVQSSFINFHQPDFLFFQVRQKNLEIVIT